MDSENQKGFIGTILFHGLLLLCVFLMSFANGGGGGGDNGTGEALGGLEVSLGEPDLGGPDMEAGYTPEQEEVTLEKTVDEETLTDDNSVAPEVVSKKPEVKTEAPKITAPVFKKTVPNPTPKKMPDSKGLFSKKGGNKGDGTTPGNQGEDDGSINGHNGDGNSPGDGNGKPGNGPGDGPGNGPGNGPSDGPGNGKGKDVTFGLRGFRAANPFKIDANKSGSGTVVIKLCVEKDGSIKSVEKTLKGNITDPYFINLAYQAVKNNTYTPTGSSVSDPCGYVTFTFKAR